MSKSNILENDAVYVCPHEIGFFLDNIFRRIIQNPKKIVGEYIEEGDTVVDVGCGPGFFSIDMARMAGIKGRTIAVDLQESMINKVKKKAKRHNVINQMEFHQCESRKLGLDLKADFILAYYMVHESPTPGAFLAEMGKMLRNQDSRILIVEPRMHVNKDKFNKMLAKAEKAGLQIIDRPKGKGGRSVLLGRA